MRSNIFDRLSFLSLFLVVVLLPIFCLPFTNIPVETSKGLLLVLGLAACIIFWAIARFSDGKITLPKSWFLISGGGILLITLLSALFSKAPQISLFGTMFDVGSFWFLFAGFVLMLMSSVIFRRNQEARVVLLGAILSSAVVMIFQGLHLFMPTVLSLGILTGKTGNILGSWNTLGLFTGFSSVMFMIVLEFFPINKIEKILLQIFVVLSILLSAAVNFQLVWILLGISALVIFVYKISFSFNRDQAEGEKVQFPIFSFIIMLVALLFFMSGQFIGGLIPNRLGLSNTEVNPSFSSTMSVTKAVLTHNPVFGIGPNKFGEAWAMYKPTEINSTGFWDISFNSGSGLLPTLVATTGFLGLLSWLLFFVLFFVTGVKSFFRGIKNGVNWEMMAFFMLSLYLFVSSSLYFTGVAMFLLSLAFSGVFVGLSSSHRENGELSISFLNDHRKSFFSILFLIILIIATAAISFKYLERFASVSYFGKALSAQTIPVAEDSIGKALALYSNDLYLRAYAQVYLVKLNSIVAKNTKDAPLSDADKADLQASFDQAVNGAQLATSFNPNNYLNFQLLGSVYQAVGSLGVKDAYSKAIEAYKTASLLNPLNPGLKLSMAGASFVDGKVKEAEKYANESLSLKKDYIDALVTLSQILKSEGNNADALTYAQAALSLSPANKDLIQYVNSFKTPAPTVPAPTKK